jgi:hypothetical protein
MQADDCDNVLPVDDELGAAAVVAAPPISFTFVDDDQADDGEHWPQQHQQASTSQVKGTNLGIAPALASSGGGSGSTGFSTTSPAPAATVVRPGTPPPRSLSLFTPTHINLTSRRRVARGACDEVHPLAAATASSNLANLGRKSPAIALHQQHQTLQQGGEGENDLDEPKKLENSLGLLTGHGNDTSLVSSNRDLSGTSNSSSISRPQQLHRSSSTNTSTTNDKTHPDNIPNNSNQNKKKNEKLNFKQRLAMENFLMAQSSNNMNPIAKEEAWRELVRAMKHSSSEYDSSMNISGSTNNNSRGGYARSNSSNANNGRWNSKKDDILGLIRIGGGLKIGAGSSDVVSIASGLTTEHYETATTMTPPTTTAVNKATAAPNLVTAAAAAAAAAPTSAIANAHATSPVELETGPGEHDELLGMTMPEPLSSSHLPPSLLPQAEVTTTKTPEQPPSNPGRLVRTITPPTFPTMVLPNILSAGGLPTVSPLSVDGMVFDDEEYVDYDDRLDQQADEKGGTTGDSRMVNNDIRLKFPIIHGEEDEEKEGGSNIIDGDKMETNSKPTGGGDAATQKKSSLFFDIGESFAANTKRLWNKDPNNTNNANVVLSLADSMSEEGESTSGCSEDRSLMRRRQQPPPLLLPSLRNDSGSSSVGMFHLPASRSSHGGSTSSDGGFEKMSLWESEMMRQVGAQQEAVVAVDGTSRHVFPNSGSLSIIAHSNEGEIVSFHESEKYSTEVTRPVSQPSTALELEHDTHQQLYQSQSMPSHSPRQVIPLPRKERHSIEMSQNSPPCQRSMKRRPKRRGVGINNYSTAQSLEEQIFCVLQQQPDSHVVGDILDEELEVGEHHDSSMNINASRVKNGTVGSAASAQDILRELRNSTSNTLQIDNSLEKSCSSKPPLGSISVGMRGLHLGPNGSKDSTSSRPHTSSSSEEHLEENSGYMRPLTPTLALAPSPRDIPRPSRCRRSVSDSTAGTPAANLVSSASSPQSIVTMPADVSSSVHNSTMSALERYCKVIGTNIEHASVMNTRLRGRIFPYTSPVTSDLMGGGATRVQIVPRRTSTNPFDTISTNPFDSPPRSIPSQKAKEPFEEQSSPIPMERSGDTYISHDASGSINKSNTSITPSSDGGVALHANGDIITASTPSQCSSPPSVLLLKPSRRDRIRARNLSPPESLQVSSIRNREPCRHENIRVSLSQLKNNGVGGSGHGTSTLVHNGNTGCYFIRDDNDDHFEIGDKNSADHENAEVETKRNSYANDVERSTRQLNGIHESSLRKATPQNQLREKLANATILDDDVVEDAVRAATECLSTATSTCSNDVSTTNEVEQTQRIAEGDGDEFFVIPSPQHRVNWSAFDPNVGCSNDFDFRPSESMDEWGDDDRWDFDEDDEWERENKGNKMYFCSPTSVAAGRHFS